MTSQTADPPLLTPAPHEDTVPDGFLPHEDTAPPGAVLRPDATHASEGGPQSVAARLLDPKGESSDLGAQRLALGALGLGVLQAAHSASLTEAALTDRLIAPVGLALAAAGTLVLSLPGAIILLTVLGAAPSWSKAWTALSRSYFVVGLLAAGFAPLVALFALTGADAMAVTGLTFCSYALAGTVGLTGLTRQLWRTQGVSTLQSQLVLFGYWGFSLFVGVYTWLRLMREVMS